MWTLFCRQNDRLEGMTAFVEKRKPNFTDNWGADRQPSVCVLESREWLTCIQPKWHQKENCGGPNLFLKKQKEKEIYVCAVFQLFEEVKGVGCLFFSWAFVLDCLGFYAVVNHDSKWTASITTILWWSAAPSMQKLSPSLLWTQSHQRFFLLSLELVRIYSFGCFVCCHTVCQSCWFNFIPTTLFLNIEMYVMVTESNLWFGFVSSQE